MTEGKSIRTDIYRKFFFSGLCRFWLLGQCYRG